MNPGHAASPPTVLDINNIEVVYNKAVQVLRGPAGASITNLAFGGPERRTLFVTDSTHGRVMTAEMDVPGLPLHRRG